MTFLRPFFVFRHSTRPTLNRSHWLKGKKKLPAWQAPAAADAGRWVSWSIESRLSCLDDGVYRIFKDGVVAYEFRGPNCFNDRVAPRIHLGLYKWAWSVPDDSGGRFDTKKTMYFDNLVVRKGFTKTVPTEPSVLSARPRLSWPATLAIGDWKRPSQTANRAVPRPRQRGGGACPWGRALRCVGAPDNATFTPKHGRHWRPTDSITWPSTMRCLAGKQWQILGDTIARDQLLSLACMLRTPNSTLDEGTDRVQFVSDGTSAGSFTATWQRLAPTAGGGFELPTLASIAPDMVLVSLQSLPAPIHVASHGPGFHSEYVSRTVWELCEQLASLRRPGQEVYISTPSPSWTDDGIAHRSGQDAVGTKKGTQHLDDTAYVSHWDVHQYFATVRAASAFNVSVLNVLDMAKYKMADRPTSNMELWCLPGSIDTWNAMLISAACRTDQPDEASAGLRERQLPRVGPSGSGSPAADGPPLLQGPNCPLSGDLIVYPHLMKSAGTELSCMLAAAFGVDAVLPLSRLSSYWRIRDADVRAFVAGKSCAELSEFKVIYGHMAYSLDSHNLLHKLADRIGKRIRFVLMFRDPFAHHLSWFRERKYLKPDNAPFIETVYPTMEQWLASPEYTPGLQLKGIHQLLFGTPFNTTGTAFAKLVLGGEEVLEVFTTETFSAMGTCALHARTNATFPVPQQARRHAPGKVLEITAGQVRLIAEHDAEEIAFYQAMR